MRGDRRRATSIMGRIDPTGWRIHKGFSFLTIHLIFFVVRSLISRSILLLIDVFIDRFSAWLSCRKRWLTRTFRGTFIPIGHRHGCFSFSQLTSTPAPQRLNFRRDRTPSLVSCLPSHANTSRASSFPGGARAPVQISSHRVPIGTHRCPRAERWSYWSLRL